MKVIDLLNKIANGEEVPKKIYIEKFNQEFTFNGITYMCDDKNSPNIYWYLYSEALKYKVEIIEEPQKHKLPEKLNLDTDKLRGKETPRTIDYLIEDKLNEIIYYLKSKGDE